MKKFGIIFLMLSVNFSFSQEVNCEDLQEFIKTKGYYKTSLANYTLGSSWLYEVTAYEYDYKIYVIAKIKRNEYDYSPKAYVYCGIPSQNWNNFQYGDYNDSDSYGERFHEYIKDYECNCN
ncbi:hypothetical protein C7447_102332 [Tenacibaculum adriaticum]|uniref:Uncharacterized protein n=1 Tax=Tenacibaculum adriaticum TaxID=413713 RepID=A0A5S5DTL4_9FLAO|nr:hypothetical protein [Tenacibaculum adriaticum]TYP99014.1 hypothetical protein C7447_102332 [Tenacibaculum adriaticum]